LRGRKKGKICGPINQRSSLTWKKCRKQKEKISLSNKGLQTLTKPKIAKEMTYETCGWCFLRRFVSRSLFSSCCCVGERSCFEVWSPSRCEGEPLSNWCSFCEIILSINIQRFRIDKK
jgi:hypothetical protein